jgi:Na+-translocating ferredoxin:NAD+ oxidoreductase RnfG subunit
MIKRVLFVLLFVTNIIIAQEKQRKEKNPVLHEVSNKDVVNNVYPEAVKVDKVNDYWYKILDNKNKTMGWAMTSTSFCKDVKGYNDLTPIMIITDKKWVIKKVALLSNWETSRFVSKLENTGFFNLWVGKKLKDAQKIEIDAHTGATFTAKAVSKNVDFLLLNGTKSLPTN